VHEIRRRLDKEHAQIRVAAKETVNKKLVSPPDVVPGFKRADDELAHVTLR
jgi:hypothetical protein